MSTTTPSLPALIFATEWEVQGFLGVTSSPSPPLKAQPWIHSMPIITRRGREITRSALDVIVTGYGPTQSRLGLRSALSRVRPRVAVIGGAAGALIPELSLGTLVIPQRVVTGFETNGADDTRSHPQVTSIRKELFDRCCAGVRQMGLGIETGPLVTVDRAAKTPTDRRQLAEDTAATAVDMETSSYLAVFDAHDIPAVVLRCVSDGVEDVLVGPRELREQDDSPWRAMSTRRVGRREMVARLRRAGQLTGAVAVELLRSGWLDLS